MVDDGLDEAAQAATEHVAAGAAEPDGRAKARKSRPAALEPDTPEGLCANCETELQGPVCHNCGQVADAYHRPVRGLLTEIVEGIFSLDGRVARTIPNLLVRPGRVTRGFLKGQRARYMPPFRLYIVASLIFFLLTPSFADFADQLNSESAGEALSMVQAGAAGVEARAELEANLARQVAAGDITQEEADEAIRALEELVARFGLTQPDASQADSQSETAPEGGDATSQAGSNTDGAQSAASPLEAEDESDGPGQVVRFSAGRGDAADGVVVGPGGNPDQIRRFFAPEDFGEPAPKGFLSLPVRRFLGERFADVTTNPAAWLDRAQAWVPRIMFVMVPVYALLLSLVYVWRRRFFFFDHLIVSLHFHSALFMAMAVAMLIGGGWAFFALALYSNAYLYRLNRVVYERGRFSSVVRTLTLDGLYIIVLSFAFLVVLLLGALIG